MDSKALRSKQVACLDNATKCFNKLDRDKLPKDPESIQAYSMFFSWMTAALRSDDYDGFSFEEVAARLSFFSSVENKTETKKLFSIGVALCVKDTNKVYTITSSLNTLWLFSNKIDREEIYSFLVETITSEFDSEFCAKFMEFLKSRNHRIAF